MSHIKNKNSHYFLFALFIFGSFSLRSQDLLKKLDAEFTNEKVYEIATFKTTRIGLGHSIETRKKGALQIALYNRYWNIPDFKGQRFLADVVSTYYGLAYAFTDDITFGMGYTNHDKIIDGYLKYRLLRQQKSSKKAPISITILQTFSHRKTVDSGINYYQPEDESTKYGFTSQVLIARKLNSNLSLQIAPVFIHSQSNELLNESKNQFAIAFSGRHKFNKHTSIVSEYYYLTNPLKSIETFNAFMVGINWEVSDLMLQFHITNARNFTEDSFITQTINNFNFKDGNLHFGVNATFILHTRKNRLKIQLD